MMIKRFYQIFLLFTLLALVSTPAFAQDQGQLSGDLMVNTSIYRYDSTIGTSTSQYSHELSSAESWLYLSYRYKGFTVATRFELFNNSPLLDPQEVYTKQGIGFYQVSKEFGKFSITGGYFYDQFGSGMVFRAYEDRNLGLDYAINGIKLNYHPNDSFFVKAFTGVQKYRFNLREQVVKGINSEKVWNIGSLRMVTGAALLNRTLDQSTMLLLANQIKAMPFEKWFVPKYNLFAGSVYNTFTFKNLSLYAEYARKTPEATFLTAESGAQELKNVPGSAIYSNLSYSTSGLGINLQYKKIDNFIIRSSPFDNLLTGVLNFLPALSKQLSYRLPARYSISAIGQGETGYSGDITYTATKHSTFTLNASYVTKPDGGQLYREYYLDWNKKFNRQFRGIFGAQSVFYNQAEYQGHPGVPDVHSITPFVELTYRFAKPITLSRKNKSGGENLLLPSIRTELQYMNTQQDKGDFAWALVELNFAPKYSLTVSDMVNLKPLDYGKPVSDEKPVHYYSASFAYTIKQTHFSIGYVKQVEGVVCTGGVCRVEPAFSGYRFSLTTNF
jgi:hypothetical protein